APMALVLMVVAPVSGQLVERLGNKALVAVGMAVGAGGLYYLSRTTTGSGYLHLLTGLVILAAGLSLSMVPATESIMGSLPPGKAGVGSAMNDTTREVGGALGVAILGSIMASRYSTAIVHSLGPWPWGRQNCRHEPSRSRQPGSRGHASRPGAPAKHRGGPGDRRGHRGPPRRMRIQGGDGRSRRRPGGRRQDDDLPALAQQGGH